MRSLALAAALLVVPVSPGHAANAPKTWTYVIERSSRNTWPLELKADVKAEGEYALIAVATAWVDRGIVGGVRGVAVVGTPAEVGGYVDSQTGEGTCDGDQASYFCFGNRQHGGVYLSGTWQPSAMFNRMYLVLHGSGATLDVYSSVGWRLRRWKGAVRLVTGDDQVAQYTPYIVGVAASDGATSSGGARGSIAFARPPCKHLNDKIGTGSARLRGGQREVDASCNAADRLNREAPVGYAPKRTTWRLDGSSAGWSDVPVRLVVMDME